jgi:hypothetical protein
MGPPPCVLSVVDRNVVMRRITYLHYIYDPTYNLPWGSHIFPYVHSSASGIRESQIHMEVEEECYFLGCGAAQSVRSRLTFQINLPFPGWRQAVRLKYCYISTRRHGVPSRQTTVLSQYIDKDKYVSVWCIGAGSVPLIVQFVDI